ncbi:hypothetical protein ANN_05288 [Periplaneta americana]|uniref:Uncharacterized protein n=1 Tax=Periplaneta americana TaxID=6978 RepID=A0ABQ8TCI4_PERAM|nr:hypothetical protein ANN_05288 [Periplaneta americana]
MGIRPIIGVRCAAEWKNSKKYHLEALELQMLESNTTVRRWSARARNETGATLNLCDKGRNGRPRTATDDAHRNRVNELLITANHCITQEHPSIQCGISREHEQSPDLNPIEYIWNRLDRRLRSREMRPTSASIVQLSAMLQEEWRRLQVDIIHKILCSNHEKVSAGLKKLFTRNQLLTKCLVSLRLNSILFRQSLMLAGSEFQSLGRAIVKEDEYEEVRWDATRVAKTDAGRREAPKGASGEQLPTSTTPASQAGPYQHRLQRQAGRRFSFWHLIGPTLSNPVEDNVGPIRCQKENLRPITASTPPSRARRLFPYPTTALKMTTQRSKRQPLIPRERGRSPEAYPHTMYTSRGSLREQRTGLFLLKARQIRTSAVEVCDTN